MRTGVGVSMRTRGVAVGGGLFRSATWSCGARLSETLLCCPGLFGLAVVDLGVNVGVGVSVAVGVGVMVGVCVGVGVGVYVGVGVTVGVGVMVGV